MGGMYGPDMGMQMEEMPMDNMPDNKTTNINWVLVSVIAGSVILGIVFGIIFGRRTMKKRDI